MHTGQTELQMKGAGTEMERRGPCCSRRPTVHTRACGCWQGGTSSRGVVVMMLHYAHSRVHDRDVTKGSVVQRYR